MVAQAKFRIEPCILVNDRVSVDRGVRYVRHDLFKKANPDGSEDAKWETERHYKDRSETKVANSTYTKARSLLRKVCLPTEIGFVCPVAKENELQAAIFAAGKLVDDANKSFKHCKITLRIVCTTIEPTNNAGVAMLEDTLTNTVASVKAALENFDMQRVREVLSSTKTLADVLADPVQKQRLVDARKQTADLLKQMAELVKEYDGNIADAMVSNAAGAILQRAAAEWDF
jgi:hypothetical protein